MASVSKRISSDNLLAVEKMKAKQSLKSIFLSSPSQIWKSRISWRIALAVFLTILAVQAAILNFTLKEFERERLGQLHEIGRAALAPRQWRALPVFAAAGENAAAADLVPA